MSRSSIEAEVLECISSLFPFETVIKEHYINYKGTKLFFDLYLKGMGILIECQGEQHSKFVSHFHGTIEVFRGQKKRDNLKIAYLQENPQLTLVYFYDKKDKITIDLVKDRIYNAQNKEW